MNRIAALAGAELRSIPGVRDVGAHTGRAITSDQVVGTNAGEVWVNIDPSADHDATLAAIRDTVAGYPGLSHAVSTYTSDRTTDVLGGDPNDVAIRVYGQEDAILRQKADEVAQALTGIDGLVDLTVVAPIEEPRLKIAVDLERAGARGVAPGDVRRAAATQVAGIEVGFLFEEQKIFEVVVWGSPEARHSIDSVRNVIVPTRDGAVRLGDVADVSISSGPSVIRREGVFRFIDVVADVRGRDFGSVMTDVNSRLAAVAFPLEYRAEVLGASLQAQADLSRLIAIVVAAALAILLLLQAAFGSWRRALFVYVALPVALVGAALGAILTGGFFSIGVVAGLFAVLTIAVRICIVSVDRYQALESAPDAELGPDLILDGARERLSPILATAIADGPRYGAVHRPRRAARDRDPPADGDRRSRWPRYFYPVRPVPGPRRVPQLRAKPGAGRGNPAGRAARHESGLMNTSRSTSTRERFTMGRINRRP